MTYKEYRGFHVYQDGQVYRPERTLERTDGVRRTFKGKWIKTRIRNADKGRGGGYEYIDLYHGNKEVEHLLLHRLVALLWVDNPNDLPQVNHKDGDRTNNHKNNLEWMTCSNNQKHAYKTLKRKRKSKLTEDQVKEVYNLRNVAGLKLESIAEMFDIAFQTVSDIARGNRFCLRKEGD